MNELEKEVMNMVVDKLEEIDNIRNTDDNFELACQIWEYEHVNGSITYSTYEAEKWVSKHFSDLREYVQDAKEDEFLTIDAFDDPEGFMVQIVIYITQHLLSSKELKIILDKYIKE